MMVVLMAAALVPAGCAPGDAEPRPAQGGRYEDLVALFHDWRAFQRPRLVDGVPDYIDHRVLQPWANNPAFFTTVFDSESDQPAREGPLAFGAVELWSYEVPLSDSRAAKIAAGLAIVPRLLEQAKTNLTGNGRDLWTYGAASIRDQSSVLERFLGRIGDARPQLQTAAAQAKQASGGRSGMNGLRCGREKRKSELGCARSPDREIAEERARGVASVLIAS